MPTEKSFLGQVKDSISEVFAGLYDELSPDSTDTEKLGASLKSAHKRTWEIVEKQIKQSYLNGKKAGNGGQSAERRPRSAPDIPPETGANPFRK